MKKLKCLISSRGLGKLFLWIMGDNILLRDGHNICTLFVGTRNKYHVLTSDRTSVLFDPV